MFKHTIVFFFFLVATVLFCNAQVVINEVQSSNVTGITDEDGDHSDWIEFYNMSDQDVDLAGYIVSDRNDIDSAGWVFPKVKIPAKSFLLVFASGKDRRVVSTKYHTIIRRGDCWKYYIPDSGMPEGWREPGFNDSLWASGPSGFGYNDGDDSTFLNNIKSLLIRKEFDIEDVNSISGMLLHVDYDDGFIAFINGQEVAMRDIDSWNSDYSQVVAGYHEAVLYSGGVPEQIDLIEKLSLLQNGKNVIAIQGHNNGVSSSDFSLIPFLTLASSAYTNNEVESFITSGITNLHTNFKISKEGEPIYLFAPDSVLVDSTRAIAIEEDYSYGRFPDGDSLFSCFKKPTPGEENIDPVEIVSDDSVFFSAPSGLYIQHFKLGMKTSNSHGVIRYTTDGSVPTSESAVYSDSLSISGDTVIRAAFFADSVARYPVTTRTYYFSSPNGLPVISISSDPKNFFDWEEGIFEMGPNAGSTNPYFGANFWQDWEKPVNIEYFDKEGLLQLNQNAGIKVFGNWSRANAQKSVALFARKEYGNGSFKYPFFHDRKNSSFESVILRNSGNDWGNAFMRDGLNSEIARGMDLERMAYQPTVVYLNGQYWGILNMREKINENYFEENYGVDEASLNLLENESSVIYGKRTDYSKLLTLLNSKTNLTAASYQKIYELVDVDCFVDYELFQIFLSNSDWPGNNIKFWNTTDGRFKWRWILFDTDASYDLWGATGNTMAYATNPNGPGWPNPPWSTLLLRKLLANNDFRNQFVNRFMDCMNTNLTGSSMISTIDSIQNLLDPEIQHHLSRWSLSYDYWKSEVQRIRNFMANRGGLMRTYMKSYFNFNMYHQLTLTLSDHQAGRVKLNTVVPGSYPFKGYYFGEVPITLKAVPNAGYRFVRWEGASTSTDISIQVNVTSDMKLNAVFEPVDKADYQMVINEINYKSGDTYDADDWVEIYNKGTQTADLAGWVLSDNDTDNQFVFPSGYILYPGDYLVVTRDGKKFSAVYPSVTNFVGDFSFGLSSSGDVVYLYDDKGNQIDRVIYGVQSPWPVEANGTGATLELKNPSFDNEQALNWSANTVGGTPGKPNSSLVSTGTLAEADVSLSCFPTCFSESTTLRFNSNKSGVYGVQIVDMQGRVVETHSNVILLEGDNSLDLFTSPEISGKGIYVVKVQTDSWIRMVKVIKK